MLFLLVVSAVVAPFSMAAWSRSRVAANQVQKARHDLLAEGLANVLAARAARTGSSEALFRRREPIACSAGAWNIRARLQAHSGLIDLNAADRQLLEVGFVSLGLEKRSAEELAIAVEYFRSGASAFTAAATQTVHVAGGYKQASFESVAELPDFSGLQDVALSDLYRTFTVNSRAGSIDAGNATKLLATHVLNAGRDSGRSGRGSDLETAYTIEVAVSQNAKGIVGSAGYIYERRQGPQTPMRRAAMVPAGSLATAPATDIGSCGALFGDSVVQMLAQ